MKKIILLLFILPYFGYSQKKEKEKISFDIMSGVYTNFKKWKENGLTAGYEISFKRKSLIYSANLFFGFGISKNIINKSGYFQAFLESDVLIGKEYDLTKNIMVQPQIGAGYLHYTNHFQEEKKNLIGLPIQCKIIFFKENDFSFGIIPRAIFNTTQNNYSFLLTLQFKN